MATTMRDRFLAIKQLDISEEFAQRIADTAARLDQVLATMAIATRPSDVDDVESSSHKRELQAEVIVFTDLYGQ